MLIFNYVFSKLFQDASFISSRTHNEMTLEVILQTKLVCMVQTNLWYFSLLENLKYINLIIMLNNIANKVYNTMVLKISNRPVIALRSVAQLFNGFSKSYNNKIGKKYSKLTTVVPLLKVILDYIQRQT